MDLLVNRIRNATEQIAELQAGKAEMQFLGDTPLAYFTFQRVPSSSSHHVRLLGNKNGIPLIGLDFSSNATGAHEARHAYQYLTQGINDGSMVFRGSKFVHLSKSGLREIQAYRLQYSILNHSLPIRVDNVDGITNKWLCELPINPYKCN